MFKYFYKHSKNPFSPSTHWEHCLLLEEDMLKLFEYIPIYYTMPDTNWKVCSPKLVDIFVRACILLEAAFKAISNDGTGRIQQFLQDCDFDWSKFFLDGQNRLGEKDDLDILDFFTFYEQYCSLKDLEVRIRYSQHISDVWINRMFMIRPFWDLKFKEGLAETSPKWWTIFNKLKHDFYSYPKVLELENTLSALGGLIAFTSVVPQCRRLLCDHGFIQDNKRNRVKLNRFGKKEEGKFIKDPWVKHSKLVLEGYENEVSMPAIACLSKLFIVPLVGDYRSVQLWSGLEQN